jgi:cysteine-rich repeat protein
MRVSSIRPAARAGSWEPPRQRRRVGVTMRHRDLSYRSALLSTSLLALLAGVSASPLGCGGPGETSGTAGAGATGGGGGGGTGGTAGMGGTGGTGGEDLTCVAGTVNGDAKCDDLDPCNGAESCSDQHTCEAGTPLADGASCDAGKVCVGGVCLDDVCGDLFVSSGEDCDDGNTTAGDGCDPDCTFSCTGLDPSKCAPADECAGVAACDDATHTCLPLAPLADGTACVGGFCLGGVCKGAQCGDGILDPGEECDDGNAIDGDGCDVACVISCVAPAVDCPAAPECQMAVCTAQSTCAVASDPQQDGVSCGVTPGFVCSNGACASPAAVCGNGTLEAGEDCDAGAANGPGTGCEANCTFSCSMSPDSCDDPNPCNGVAVCAQVMLGGSVGQQCQPGTPLANCAACPGGLCGAGACVASTCGDGCVDPGAGEDCEPPGSPSCDATCQTVIVAVCGNGAREGAEQCDDGGVLNLDGCDSACKFEQDQRVNWFKMQWVADAYCTANQLGSAFIGALAQNQMQSSLDGGIAAGSINILFKVMDLDDLTGTSDPVVSLGVVNGAPETNMGMLPYNGTADLDWWYNVDPLSIDGNRNPQTLLPGSIAAKVVNAGPGTLNLLLILGGQPAPLKVTQAKITGTLGVTSVPLTSTGLPPGHLAFENLDPVLSTFAAMGQPNANGAAKLCGNVSAASLALVPIPVALTGGGIGACAQNYSAQNSMLDVLIGGCTILNVQQIVTKQPDEVDPAVLLPGAGGPYSFTANAVTKIVDTCRDKFNTVVTFPECLQAAAYSSFFKLTTDRVILK